MGLLDRIRNIIRANVNDIANRADDPEKALDLMISDMSQDLVNVRQAASLAIAAQNRLQAEYDQRMQLVQQWQQRAELAVDNGDDNLAREALKRKLQYQSEAKQLHESIAAQSGHTDELRSHVQDLDNRMQQAVMQRNQLIARYRVAEATRSLEEESARHGRLTETLAELQSRTADAEAQAAAYHELSHDSLEDKFAQLESGSTSVDNELAALKKQRQLPGGHS